MANTSVVERDTVYCGIVIQMVSTLCHYELETHLISLAKLTHTDGLVWALWYHWWQNPTL
jgi:hypothetical protein